MVLPYDNIADEARVWVYQSNRGLTPNEKSLIINYLEAELAAWQAHQQPLQAAVEVFDECFVVLAVDEQYESPSGCAIDKSVHWFQTLGQRLGLDFLDRSVKIINNHQQVVSVPINQIKTAVANGTITADTLIVNTLAKTKADWTHHRLQPAAEGWLKRYFVVTH
jgi:hypothetical protein